MPQKANNNAIGFRVRARVSVLLWRVQQFQFEGLQSVWLLGLDSR